MEKEIPMNNIDDYSVDKMAIAMKEKMRYSREVKGRSGWNDKDDCSHEFLVSLLHEHVAKGDPVDVANIAMMLYMRGERTNLQ
jgi:hypothetical protein